MNCFAACLAVCIVMYDRYISLSIESTEDFDTELIMNCGAPTVSFIGYYYYYYFKKECHDVSKSIF